ncbi:MAG: ABC transporter ATP-binding protein [Candidatus Nezhaarchaeales archaeon]
MKRVVVETVNLTKEYNGFTAVKNLNMKVYTGEIFGLLGPNGAGKTTTILMLLGLIPPTRGEAWVDGYSVTRDTIEVRKRVGFVPENIGLYDDLTARENLSFTAELNGITGEEKRKRIDELLEKVGLKDWADERVSKFSRGMKQRLAIADALIKRPKVLMLDEPTAGIDPAGAEYVLSLIKKLSREEKVTVLMSSHQLYQVQKICDRVAIMNRGELVAVGSVEDLAGREKITEAEFDVVSEDLIQAVWDLEGVKDVIKMGNKLIVRAERDLRREIARLALDKGSLVLELKLRIPSLDELYVKYFGGR